MGRSQMTLPMVRARRDLLPRMRAERLLPTIAATRAVSTPRITEEKCAARGEDAEQGVVRRRA